MFVKEGTNIKEEIPSMQGQYRYSPDTLLFELEHLSNIGISSVMLFGIPNHKDAYASGAYAQDGVIQTALQLAKKNSQTCIILLTFAYANIPLTVIAECSAVKP